MFPSMECESSARAHVCVLGSAYATGVRVFVCYEMSAVAIIRVKRYFERRAKHTTSPKRDRVNNGNPFVFGYPFDLFEGVSRPEGLNCGW